MSDWKKYSLGEIYIVNSGLSKSKESFGFGETFISFKDVFYNWFLPENPEGLVNSNEKDQLTCSVKEGDILLTRTSETSDEIGMSSVALKDYPKSTFNGFCKRLRVKEDAPIKVSPLFIGYSLRSRIFRKSVAQYSTMTTRASLNGDSIRRIVLRFPPYEEQQEIGLILNKLDEKIELLQVQNKTLEAIAQTIFKEWFGKYQIGDELPKGWSVEILSNVVNLQQGKYIKANLLSEFRDSIKRNPVYGGGGIRGYIQDYQYQNSQVILTCRGNGCGFIQYSEPKATITNSCMALEDNESVLNSRFLYLLTKILDFDSVISGSAQPQITITNIQGLEIIVPEENILLKFDNAIKPIFNKIQDNNSQIQTLTKTRDTLLPKLMSGAIRVNKKIKAAT